MRKIVIVYDDAFLKHTPPRYHCESPARVRSIVEHLKEVGLLDKLLVRPRQASIEDLYLVHDKNYVDIIVRLLEKGSHAYIDGDTYISSGTRDAALTAVGAVMTGVDMILSGETQSFFAPVRPPGHHAGVAGRALTAPTQGFCIFNNVAIGAEYALRRGAKRVAIVDIDAHHGNGTQEIFYGTDKVLYISLHQDPLTLYPGTGFPHEVGEGAGEGFNVNIPMPPGSGDDVYIQALEEIVMPILEQYRPDIVLVSLGFDAHTNDPLTGLDITLHTYEALFLLLKRGLEKGLFRGVGYVLEGGYDTGVLAKGSEILVKIMLDEDYSVGERKRDSPQVVQQKARRVLKEVREIQSRYWNLK